jgi:hypothetical protein
MASLSPDPPVQKFQAAEFSSTRSLILDFEKFHDFEKFQCRAQAGQTRSSSRAAFSDDSGRVLCAPSPRDLASVSAKILIGNEPDPFDPILRISTNVTTQRIRRGSSPCSAPRRQYRAQPGRHQQSRVAAAQSGVVHFYSAQRWLFEPGISADRAVRRRQGSHPGNRSLHQRGRVQSQHGLLLFSAGHLFSMPGWAGGFPIRSGRCLRF